MRVLSLFDGMSCGQIALNRLGIKYSAYYASEIDKNAIKVTMSNYPNTIQLGDITKVNGYNLPKIDLLIGGSPCQGFSFAGKGLNFDDPRSKLFFEYVRLLKETNPKYFLLENVKMKKEHQDVISSYLGVEPILINSSLVSAQNRERLYWTNIPNVSIPKDKGIVVKDIICGHIDEKIVIPSKYIPNIKEDITEKQNKTIRLGGYMKQGQGQRIYSMMGKSVCLSALGGGWGAKTGLYLDNGLIRKPTQNELEALQTVPIGYTKQAKYTEAAKMLGNGWTIDIICHILKELLKTS